MIDKLDVYIWDKRIGSLISSKQGYKNLICFYHDPSARQYGYEISPLRAPLSGIGAQKGLPVYPEARKEFYGLPSFIADSMPDHWGNLVFSEWAKSRKIKSKELTALDRLAYIGRRGMGALEFLPPASAELENPFRVEIAELSKLAQTALSDAKKFKAVMSPDFMIESLFKVGTSAGGRRPKAVVNVNMSTGECYSGQVASPKEGFIPMIVKFDEHSDIPTTRIEYSYYLMAKEAGMKMMTCYLLEGERETHFLTERFDRIGNEKIHVQTLAAMNPDASSYEDLFETALRIGIVPSEVQQLFLQMVMNVLGRNVDDHNKNFSFMMGKDGVWHIAPAYDFTFSVDVSAPFYVNRHCLTLNGKNDEISKSDLLHIASRYGIKGVSKIIDQAIEAVSNYRKYASLAGVPDHWITRIESEIIALK